MKNIFNSIILIVMTNQAIAMQQSSPDFVAQKIQEITGGLEQEINKKNVKIQEMEEDINKLRGLFRKFAAELPKFGIGSDNITEEQVLVFINNVKKLGANAKANSAKNQETDRKLKGAIEEIQRMRNEVAKVNSEKKTLESDKEQLTTNYRALQKKAQKLEEISDQSSDNEIDGFIDSEYEADQDENSNPLTADDSHKLRLMKMSSDTAAILSPHLSRFVGFKGSSLDYYDLTAQRSITLKMVKNGKNTTFYLKTNNGKYLSIDDNGLIILVSDAEKMLFSIAGDQNILIGGNSVEDMVNPAYGI